MAVCHAKVVDIQSVAQFDCELDGAGERLVVLIFWVKSNPKSMLTFPLIKDIESGYTDSMLVLQVDADRFRDIAKTYEVNLLPTVFTIRNPEVSKLVGAKSAYYGLKKHIEEQLKEMGV